MRVQVLLCAIWLVACASGKPGGQNNGGDDDSGVSTFEDAAVDAPPKNGFGEPCTSNMQCESGLCILVGTSGQCTMTCGDCPPNYGCLGVTGIQVEGQVTFVCVPTSSQLCTTCTQDSECTLIGQDKCVTYPDGDKACAQDCSTVSCPTGFTCNTVNIGGTNYKQCMQASGACDCTATNPGAMQPCNITTPWNVCVGSQTCAGASGWGTCQPPSMTDDPDATYTDQNCDGLDGDMARAIFVAGGGANNATCGLTYMTPCQTISYGITRAVSAGRPHVYVQAGMYNEVVVLANGVSVYGGYNFNWKRGAYSDPQHRVTINGGEDTGGDSEWLAVRAHSIPTQVTLADVVIKGPNASGTAGTSGRDGKSSYGVHAVNAKLALTRVQIISGNGAGGGAGGNGLDAVIVDRQSYMDGGTGGNGEEFTSACNNSSRGGSGPAGTNTCSSSPSSRAMNGGTGGAGGTMDTNCGIFSLDLNARPGSNGSTAAFVNGTFGAAGSGGSGGETCGATTGGNPGFIANGSAGAGASGGYLSNGYWYARAGTTGGTGQNGSGGGGGGGGGGCDNGEDATGGGGGGGGAGGCAARSGGTGGGGGGGSLGVLATTSSQIAITDCELVRGVAGAGGNGGYGGRGQSGGLRGMYGLHPGSAQPGFGGAGAHGGHGGGGGGGAGGWAIGVVQTSDSTITGTCTQSGGGAGSAGNGGASAPFAPASEQDGSNGGSGTAGTVTTTRTCASAASC
jgi:hypothetical protein